METIKITTAQNIDIDYEIAGLGERILARLIDLGIFIGLFLCALIAASSIQGDQTVSGVVAIALFVLLFVFYDLLCEIFMNGQSVGKRVMKIKVISLNGSRPSIGQYLLRWLFRIVDFSLTSELCALISVAVSEKKQRIGDMVAGTTLVRTHPRTKIDSIAFMPDSDEYEVIFKEAIQLNDQDVALIHEVINNYIKTNNNVLVYNMALRIKSHLGVTLPAGMNDMQFLQTIIKDYNYLSAQADLV